MNTVLFKYVLSFVLVGCITTCCSPSATHAAQPRVLQFPDDAVGVVTQSELPYLERSQGAAQEFSHVQQAKGRVHLSDDNYVGLKISGKHVGDLSFLGQLPSTAIETLSISRASLGPEQMAWIAKLKSLRKLDFSNCTISPTAFDSLGSELQDLQAFSITGPVDDIPYTKGLSGWLAKLSKLETLFCRPYLDANAWRTLADHPTLRSINIRIGEDSKQVLEAIARLPKLERLVVLQEQEIDAEVADKFALLKSVSSIRWFRGTVDGKLLRAFAKSGKLQELEILANLTVEVIEDLKLLRTLRSLEIRLLDQLDEGPGLPDFTASLFELPQLAEWPTLENVTPQLFKKLAECERIEKLVIKGTAGGATQADAEQLTQLSNLRYLHLEWVPFDDQAIQKLSDLSKLETLKLWATGASGAGFSALNELPELQTVMFFHRSLGQEPSLASLADLPKLVDLTIGGDQLLPRHIEPIKECHKLRKLYAIAGVFIDDTAAEWIGQMKEINTLLLVDDCLITDRGVQSIAQLSSLQQLWVRGLISPEGVKKLAAIPSMQRLQVRSLNLSEVETADLSKSFDYLPSLYFRPLRPHIGEFTVGDDGFLRKGEKDTRVEVDKLEGKIAPLLHGKAYPNGKNFSIDNLQGKVVLIEFWGAWREPCQEKEPELKRLYSQYHHKGLEIIGVHSQKDAEHLQPYMDENPLPWSSLLDSSGKFVNSYRVNEYPSFHIVDRKGNLRVADAHFYGLESVLQSLLNESP